MGFNIRLLKTRIGFSVTVILLIIMAVIAIAIYQQTESVLKSQVDSKIKIVNKVQTSNINIMVRDLK